MKMGVDKYIFSAGAILALAMGLSDAMSWVEDGGMVSTVASVILALLGIGIGFMNIQRSESVPFLVAAVSLAIGSLVLGYLGIVGAYLSPILTRFGIMVAGTSLVVSVSALFRTMKA